MTKNKKKRSSPKMEDVFPQIQVDTYVQMHTRVKLLGGCRCRPYSNYWRDTVNLLGGIYPPPGFGIPDYTAACDQSRCNNDPLDVSHRLLSTFGSENRFINPPFLLNGNSHYYIQFVNSNLALGHTIVRQTWLLFKRYRSFRLLQVRR